MQEILDYLYGLERLGIKLGLENTEIVLERLGNPQKSFPCVHITGTNGKGSTSAFLASIMQQAGYKVGLYTSPHLVRFNERIKINGAEISDQDLANLTREVRAKCEGVNPTFFEFTTALAFLYFARGKIDFAVIEVGMGARLDATNVVIPEVAVITNVELDHLKYLGSTKEAIAKEKAAIIKTGVPLVTHETDPKIVAYFREECRKKDSEIWVVGEKVRITPLSSSSSLLDGQPFYVSGLVKGDYSTKILGKHQLQNAATALIVAEILRLRGWKLSTESIKKGIAQAEWPGRLEVLSCRPFLMVDGAHNVAGMKTVVEFVSELPQRQILILGVAEDKDIFSLARMVVPLFEKVIVTQGSYKPAPTGKIAKEARKYAEVVWEIPNSGEALKFALSQVQEGRLIFATGSLYLVGDIIKYHNLFKSNPALSKL